MDIKKSDYRSITYSMLIQWLSILHTRWRYILVVIWSYFEFLVRVSLFWVIFSPIFRHIMILEASINKKSCLNLKLVFTVISRGPGNDVIPKRGIIWPIIVSFDSQDERIKKVKTSSMKYKTFTLSSKQVGEIIAVYNGFQIFGI